MGRHPPERPVAPETFAGAAKHGGEENEYPGILQKNPRNFSRSGVGAMAGHRPRGSAAPPVTSARRPPSGAGAGPPLLRKGAIAPKKTHRVKKSFGRKNHLSVLRFSRTRPSRLSPRFYPSRIFLVRAEEFIILA
jgi:hypothetical protein